MTALEKLAIRRIKAMADDMDLNPDLISPFVAKSSDEISRVEKAREQVWRASINARREISATMLFLTRCHQSNRKNLSQLSVMKFMAGDVRVKFSYCSATSVYYVSRTGLLYRLTRRQTVTRKGRLHSMKRSRSVLYSLGYRYFGLGRNFKRFQPDTV